MKKNYRYLAKTDERYARGTKIVPLRELETDYMAQRVLSVCMQLFKKLIKEIKASVYLKDGLLLLVLRKLLAMFRKQGILSSKGQKLVLRMKMSGWKQYDYRFGCFELSLLRRKLAYAWPSGYGV